MSRDFPVVSAWAQRAYGDSGLWNGRLLDGYLDDAATATPDRLAVVDAGTRLTYTELLERVDRIAGGLRELGVGRGDVVAMQLPNWWEALAVHFATLRLGAVSNPIMPILRERDMAYVLEQGCAKVLVSAADYRGFDHGALALRVAEYLPDLQHVVTVRGRRAGAIDLDHLGADAAAGAASPDRGADDPVVLLYTSGTEAKPKGAVHSHNTLGYENRTMIELYRLSAADVVWAPSPIAHITGVLFAFHLPVMLRAPVVMQDIWDAERALALIEAERCSFVVAATPFLHGITYSPQQPHTDTSSLRTFVCGGADVPPALIRDAGVALGVRAVRLYGSTEIPTLTGSSAEASLEHRATTDGRPIADAGVRIVGDDGQDAPVGEPGLIVARGAEAMLGYLGAAVQPFDLEGWLDTGDLGRMDADGYVQIVGRRKDIILRGGENISAKEIEDLLYTHPDIADVAVVAVADPRLTERACAVVVARPGAKIDLASIVAFLEDKSIARQKFPERLEIVSELPKTATGKVQKFQLRQLVAERSASTG